MGQKIENAEKTVEKASEVIGVLGMVVSVAGAILKALSGNNK
jgi:hypothetical protein